MCSNSFNLSDLDDYFLTNCFFEALQNIIYIDEEHMFFRKTLPYRDIQKASDTKIFDSDLHVFELPPLLYAIVFINITLPSFTTVTTGDNGLRTIFTIEPKSAVLGLLEKFPYSTWIYKTGIYSRNFHK